MTIISIKCDIFIPLEYNDKTKIEKEKFLIVFEELGEIFGGCSVDANSLINGRWINPDTNEAMDDKLRPYQIMCEKTTKNIQLLANYKEKLKEMFQQFDIFMYYVEVHRF